MEIRNWTPANIFEARDKIVETKNMGKVMVKLYVAELETLAAIREREEAQEMAIPKPCIACVKGGT